ncbi:hypothetical protein F4860DRAFT_513871 [Xylaria cubensis]|nr:hypothetical protein F4860DRAFT_513871 [Xylaria cubensis]
MPSTYRDTVPYKWYLAGDENGDRPHRMPAFNTDGQGRVMLAAGELFCRVSEDGGQTLCHDLASDDTNTGSVMFLAYNKGDLPGTDGGLGDVDFGAGFPVSLGAV